MKKLFFVLVMACVMGGVVAFPGAAHANTFSLYTMEGFVEMLIKSGIIDARAQDRARDIVRALERIEAQNGAPLPKEAPAVSVRVSQYIEHAGRTYSRSSDIEGLLLLVKNESDEPVTLYAYRGCHIVYTISKDGEVIYDSQTTPACKAKERVSYILNARDTRMFEMIHRRTDRALQKGEYEIEITYPGYGSGKTVIEVR